MKNETTKVKTEVKQELNLSENFLREYEFEGKVDWSYASYSQMF